jgi:hypothetical protein
MPRSARTASRNLHGVRRHEFATGGPKSMGSRPACRGAGSRRPSALLNCRGCRPCGAGHWYAHAPHGAMRGRSARCRGQAGAEHGTPEECRAAGGLQEHLVCMCRRPGRGCVVRPGRHRGVGAPGGERAAAAGSGRTCSPCCHGLGAGAIGRRRIPRGAVGADEGCSERWGRGLSVCWSPTACCRQGERASGCRP